MRPLWIYLLQGKRYGEINSNVAESFNAWIKDTRHFPITKMIDVIRVKLMKTFAERAEDAKKWNTVLCPKMDKKLQEAVKEVRS
ncbi:hypothetical protein LguiA_021187 [Lonicera macranthoides]